MIVDDEYGKNRLQFSDPARNPRAMLSPMSKVLLGALLVVVAILLFFPFEFDHGDEGRVLRAAMLAAHFPTFAVIALAMQGLLFRRMRAATAWSGTAVLSLIVIVGVEFIQPRFGRSASVTDALVGLAGALGAVLWLATRGRYRPPQTRWFLLGGATVFSLLLFPAFAEIAAIRSRDLRFPVLGDFESAGELHVWESRGGLPRDKSELSRSTTPVSQGRQSLCVRTQDGKGHGVQFNTGRGNWNYYQRLSFDLFNPGEPFALQLRILDEYSTGKPSSRFEAAVALSPGWNKVSFPISDIALAPKGRRLVLSNVKRLELVTNSEIPGRVFYLDNVRLEGDALRSAARICEFLDS